MPNPVDPSYFRPSKYFFIDYFKKYCHPEKERISWCKPMRDLRKKASDAPKGDEEGLKMKKLMSVIMNKGTSPLCSMNVKHKRTVPATPSVNKGIS